MVVFLLFSFHLPDCLCFFVTPKTGRDGRSCPWDKYLKGSLYTLGGVLLTFLSVGCCSRSFSFLFRSTLLRLWGSKKRPPPSRIRIRVDCVRVSITHEPVSLHGLLQLVTSRHWLHYYPPSCFSSCFSLFLLFITLSHFFLLSIVSLLPSLLIFLCLSYP